MKNHITNEYGDCFYCVCKDKGCSMLYNLYVEKAHRRQGKATELATMAISKIRETGYNGDIKIVAEPEENSISKKDLIRFYKSLNLKVVEKNLEKQTITGITDAVFIPIGEM